MGPSELRILGLTETKVSWSWLSMSLCAAPAGLPIAPASHLPAGQEPKPDHNQHGFDDVPPLFWLPKSVQLGMWGTAARSSPRPK